VCVNGKILVPLSIVKLFYKCKIYNDLGTVFLIATIILMVLTLTGVIPITTKTEFKVIVVVLAIGFSVSLTMISISYADKKIKKREQYYR